MNSDINNRQELFEMYMSMIFAIANSDPSISSAISINSSNGLAELGELIGPGIINELITQPSVNSPDQQKITEKRDVIELLNNLYCTYAEEKSDQTYKISNTDDLIKIINNPIVAIKPLIMSPNPNPTMILGYVRFAEFLKTEVFNLKSDKSEEVFASICEYIKQINKLPMQTYLTLQSWNKPLIDPTLNQRTGYNRCGIIFPSELIKSYNDLSISCKFSHNKCDHLSVAYLLWKYICYELLGDVNKPLNIDMQIADIIVDKANELLSEEDGSTLNKLLKISCINLVDINTDLNIVQTYSEYIDINDTKDKIISETAENIADHWIKINKKLKSIDYKETIFNWGMRYLTEDEKMAIIEWVGDEHSLMEKIDFLNNLSDKYESDFTTIENISESDMAELNKVIGMEIIPGLDIYSYVGLTANLLNEKYERIGKAIKSFEDMFCSGDQFKSMRTKWLKIIAKNGKIFGNNSMWLHVSLILFRRLDEPGIDSISDDELVRLENSRNRELNMSVEDRSIMANTKQDSRQKWLNSWNTLDKSSFTESIKSADLKSTDSADIRCVICQDDLFSEDSEGKIDDESNNYATKTECGHYFHMNCLKTHCDIMWSSAKPNIECPCCRHVLHTDEIEKID
jgi:hypothetical protein